jgi:3-oxoacyl-[acyl-carrier protein] reductase
MKHNTIIITGTRKGIGEYLASYYLNHGYNVIGCSRSEASIAHLNYRHYCLDVADENEVKKMFLELSKSYAKIDVLINNAGIGSMNHVVLTPLKTVQNIINTNFIGTFLFCRETSKLMMKHKYGRIINFSTVAYPLNLEGEAIYTASKAAIESFTKILAKELGQFNITVNSIGPSPIKTDLVKNIQHAKINSLIEMQIIKRFGEFIDISNVIDFYLREESSFITGQTIYLGGIS